MVFVFRTCLCQSIEYGWMKEQFNVVIHSN